ncbi:MAG TPA: hypothetical protein VK277_06570 [Acidimicrobiales bacterium]|nr:hypothetical protein [Acidimicrobiales bacterium]
MTPRATRGETSRWPEGDPTKVYVYVGDGDFANLVAAERCRGRPFAYEVETMGKLNPEQGFATGASWVPMTCTEATVTARLPS